MKNSEHMSFFDDTETKAILHEGIVHTVLACLLQLYLGAAADWGGYPISLPSHTYIPPLPPILWTEKERGLHTRRAVS